MCFDDYLIRHVHNICGLALAAVFLPTLGLAGPYDYQCTTKAGYKINDDGTFTAVLPKDSALIGEQFAVDRNTGRIVGSIFDNGSSDSKISVVNRGDPKGYAFEVFTKRRDRAELLIIAEYRDVELKPFVGFILGGTLTGVCK